MHQEALFPDELAELVASATYKPGWRVELADMDRGQGSSGLTLRITATAVDTYDPGTPIAVWHFFPVPPAAYNRQSWQRWLFEQILLVERHEAAEFFQVDGSRPYAPNHGPGWDPYLITELTTDEARRTTFRGELSEGRP
jgi:hypothetical protein